MSYSLIYFQIIVVIFFNKKKKFLLFSIRFTWWFTFLACSCYLLSYLACATSPWFAQRTTDRLRTPRSLRRPARRTTFCRCSPRRICLSGMSCCSASRWDHWPEIADADASWTSCSSSPHFRRTRHRNSWADPCIWSPICPDSNNSHILSI